MKLERAKKKKKLEYLNEKTFRDRGSGFVEILSYKLWDNCSKTVAWGDKFIIWSC